MCGILGGFGQAVDPLAIRSLALLNESRGRQSFGVFDALHRFHKEAEAVSKCIKNKEFSKFIRRGCDTPFIVAHTRQATLGKICTENAHPFEYGPVLGCHNGSLTAPTEYAVDSQYAMDLLSKADPGEYQKALGKVAGWYVLVWGDRRDGKLYFLNWNGQLSFVEAEKNTWYFSSSDDHLEQALGIKAKVEARHGDVMFYDPKRPEAGLRIFKEKFVGAERQVVVRDWSKSNHNNHYYSGGFHDPNNPLKYTGDVRRFQKKGFWYARVNGYSNPAHWRYVICQEALNNRIKNNVDNTDVGWRFLVDETKKELDKVVDLYKEAKQAGSDTEVIELKPEDVVKEDKGPPPTVEDLAKLAEKKELIKDDSIDDMVERMVKDGIIQGEDLKRCREIRRKALLEAGYKEETAIEQILFTEGWYPEQSKALTA